MTRSDLATSLITLQEQPENAEIFLMAVLIDHTGCSTVHSGIADDDTVIKGLQALTHQTLLSISSNNRINLPN